MIIDNSIPIWMISISDNPISQYWKSEVIDSWTGKGYNVNHFEAIVPRNLNLFEGELEFKSARSGRLLTDTEKAVWCSHYSLWKKALEHPLIIIEHDILLHEKLPSKFGNEFIDSFSSTYVPSAKQYRLLPAGAYYITPQGAETIIQSATLKPIFGNVDAYIHTIGLDLNKQIPNSYGSELIAEQMFDETIGTTIDHGRKK